jgi:hypothetical protein
VIESVTGLCPSRIRGILSSFENLDARKSLPVPKKPTGPLHDDHLRHARDVVPAIAVSQRTTGID